MSTLATPFSKALIHPDDTLFRFPPFKVQVFYKTPQDKSTALQSKAQITQQDRTSKAAKVGISKRSSSKQRNVTHVSRVQMSAIKDWTPQEQSDFPLSPLFLFSLPVTQASRLELAGGSRGRKHRWEGSRTFPSQWQSLGWPSCSWSHNLSTIRPGVRCLLMPFPKGLALPKILLALLLQ